MAALLLRGDVAFVMNDILFQLLQVAIGNRKELTFPSLRETSGQAGSGQAHLSADEWAQLTSSSSFAPHQSSNSDLALDSVWRQLRLEFKKQGMLGIGYVGITKLPQPQCPPIQILAQWVHNAEKIRKKNQKMNEECRKVCELLDHDGFYSCVLKGQSNLVNYPEDLREYRTAGDIDVLCWPKGLIQIAEGDEKSAHYVTYEGKRAVIEYVLMQHRLEGTPMPEVQYHHVDWEYPSTGSGQVPTPVEVHFRASWLNNPFANRRLQRWTEEHKGCVSRYCPPGSCGGGLRKSEGVAPGYSDKALQAKTLAESSNTGFQPEQASSKGGLQPEQGFPIPSAGFNVVYQLVHINRHLFNEGIGLRQILDYYFVLKAWKKELDALSTEGSKQTMAMWEAGLAQSVPSKEQVMHTLNSFNLAKFAGALMYVLQHVFDPWVSEGFPSTNSGQAPISEFQDWQERWPWMLCPPNEKEGRFLLNEIMLAGNFGKYDDRIKHGGSQLSHAWEKTKHNMRLLTHYPEEVMWEPVFRLYHWLWRKLELWRF